MKRLLLTASAIALSIAPALALNLPPEERPIDAAVTFLGLQYDPHANLGIVDATEAHIGETLEVNPVPNAKCAWTVRKRDHTYVEFIDFSKLSDEVELSVSGIGYGTLTIPGTGRAACYTWDKGGMLKAGKIQCEDHVTLTLTPVEARDAVRALRYIHAHVCPPAEMPF